MQSVKKTGNGRSIVCENRANKVLTTWMKSLKLSGIMIARGDMGISTIRKWFQFTKNMIITKVEMRLKVKSLSQQQTCLKPYLKNHVQRVQKAYQDVFNAVIIGDETLQCFRVSLQIFQNHPRSQLLRWQLASKNAQTLLKNTGRLSSWLSHNSKR